MTTTPTKNAKGWVAYHAKCEQRKYASRSQAARAMTSKKKSR